MFDNFFLICLVNIWEVLKNLYKASYIYLDFSIKTALLFT